MSWKKFWMSINTETFLDICMPCVAIIVPGFMGQTKCGQHNVGMLA